MEQEFKGKAALVTGAATGNGEAIARRLFQGGASVILAGHNKKDLEALARDMDKTGKNCIGFEADVRDLKAMQDAVAVAIKTFGGLHLAVNNAGKTGPAETLIADLAPEDWEDVISTNLTGMYTSLKAELPAILKSKGGAIVNLSSGNGVVGVAGLAAYTTTKHGVIGLTKSVALEYADKNIRVNCIGPGYVATPRIKEMGEEALEAMGQLHPMGRLATREEVAEFTAFLLSDRASFCTGGFYPLDGGYTAR